MCVKNKKICEIFALIIAHLSHRRYCVATLGSAYFTARRWTIQPPKTIAPATAPVNRANFHSRQKRPRPVAMTNPLNTFSIPPPLGLRVKEKNGVDELGRLSTPGLFSFREPPYLISLLIGEKFAIVTKW